MHELGIVFHIIDRVERVGRENGLEKVSAVVLELGEVSGVVPGAQPVPRQVSQGSRRSTVTAFSQPKAASSKEMVTLARRVSPFRGALGLALSPNSSSLPPP